MALVFGEDGRVAYIGAHLRPEVKVALQEEAQDSKQSMSAIISKAVERELDARGRKRKEE